MRVETTSYFTSVSKALSELVFLRMRYALVATLFGSLLFAAELKSEIIPDKAIDNAATSAFTSDEINKKANVAWMQIDTAAQVLENGFYSQSVPWIVVSDVEVSANEQMLSYDAYDGSNPVFVSTEQSPYFWGHDTYNDAILSFEYLSTADAKAKVLLMARYGLELEAQPSGEWTKVFVRYRTPRYDEANNKTDSMLILEHLVNDKLIGKNLTIDAPTEQTLIAWEAPFGPVAFYSTQGQLALRNINMQRANFDKVTLPAQSGGSNNIEDLIDIVELGHRKFINNGCGECHSLKPNDTSVKTGPNLFGLMQQPPRDREIADPEGHRFNVKADELYLRKSIRHPSDELAIAESGATIGQSYWPIMPRYPKEALSDADIRAIAAYLKTYNTAAVQGPVVHYEDASGPTEYDPLADPSQLLVFDKTRIQRGPMPTLSGRSIHVGQVNGLHYSFDPRVLGIAKIWQGGYLQASGEFENRGGNGLVPGYAHIENKLGNLGVLFAPLNTDKSKIDFSFKEPVFDDIALLKELTYSTQEHGDLLAQVNAQFLGYSLDSTVPQANPIFNYRIADNLLSVEHILDVSGDVVIRVSGNISTAQSFTLNLGVLSSVEVSTGNIRDGVWTLTATGDVNAQLRAKMNVAKDYWQPSSDKFAYERQTVTKEPASAELPTGYSIESIIAPKDNAGRPQLFEALGMALADDGTVVVATRTAGIWHLKDGQWSLFAEGLFDSLGVVIEDEAGYDIVVGSKAELSRIKDTNGDGMADEYTTLFDAFTNASNYHTYVHGPVKDKQGNYYLNLNLADNRHAIYQGGGDVMGSHGGYVGWAVKVRPSGDYELFANGLRSPAGLGAAPDGQLWYADNQGDFVATSKIFTLEQNAFYGHPASLIDLPGMLPESPDIRWEKVKDARKRAAILVPQSRVANSPGNPSWDTSGGKFGPFAGQMLIGDQTQSNLHRVVTEQINGKTQGAIIPFMSNMQSGIMRQVMLADGSLLLGQTGRGWRAKGGKITALQQVRWDQKSIPIEIKDMKVTPTGFEIILTRALNDDVTHADVRSQLAIESWLYRDAPDYGSDEMDLRQEAIKQLVLSADRTHIFIDLDTLEQPQVHPDQTARVYHVSLSTEALVPEDLAKSLSAYYTLYSFLPDSVITPFNAEDKGFTRLFEPDLSNATFNDQAWRFEGENLVADKDEMLWTRKDYDNFELSLEFKTGSETNSGVIIYVSDVNNWVQYSLEIQVADDYADKWKSMDKTWQSGAFFGHKGATHSAIKPPEQWNSMHITAKGKMVTVSMNGRVINTMNLDDWTSSTNNPDGSSIPEWLSVAKAQLPTKGKIGFQGKHAGAPIVFRNIYVRDLP